jgi:NET1-associated nuclear protein 1 (U3 small nucleolar RNA-associated protein 17)
MADTNSTAQLKRKRESAEAQRKKAKTGKSKPAAGAETTPSKTKSATPEARATPNSTPKTQTANDKDAPAVGETDVPPPSVAVVVETQKQVENTRKERSPDPWSISAPQGGWFLPQDPVFSPDEKYLLLGKLKALDVYAADTSLLVRSLPLGASSMALAYALSSTDPNLVYVADTAGIISLWNWTDGSKLGRWGIGANVQHLVVVEQPTTCRDLVFTHEADGKHIVNVHALYTGDEASKTEVKQILRTSRPITEMQVLLQGKLIVLSTPNSMIVGKRRKFKQTALQDFEYTWREFEMSKRITTFNAFVQISGDKDKALVDARDHLDLAVGDEEGVIYLFEDVISRFVAVEKSQKDASDKKVGPESLTPKRLHWHRTAVRSLKYSLDGEMSLALRRAL